MRSLSESHVTDGSMVGQIVASMVGAVISLALADELLKELHSRRIFRESGYKIFNVRM